MNTRVQTETLFLPDRNVVSVIKDSNAGGQQKGLKQQEMLERLREIDKPQYAISPLLSLIEGEHGREVSTEEMMAWLIKETQALADFFAAASTDFAFLNNAAGTFVSFFTGMREAKADERAELVVRGRQLVVQKVALPQRRKVEEKLRDIAEELHLDPGDASLMLLVACLHGSDSARSVIKPNALIKHALKKAYNVLADIHHIPLIAMVRAVARMLAIPISVQFLTLDEGLNHVQQCIEIDASSLAHNSYIQLKQHYLPPLFPDTAKDDAIALVARITAPRTQA